MASARWQPPHEDDAQPVLKRRPLRDDSEMDITPMIDITFLLLIFFLVASVPDAQTAIELPPAVHGTTASKQTSVIVTIAEGSTGGPPLVYLADGKVGPPLPDDHAEQQARLQEALEKGLSEGKSTMLIKAARSLKIREVSRVAAAASLVDGVQLHVAVLESE